MIRLALESDIPAINDIYNEAVDTRSATADLEHISLEQRQAWYSEHVESGYPIFVFEEESKVIAWASLSPYRKGRRAVRHVAELSYYVDLNFLRRGIGTGLMQYAIENSPKYGFEILICILLSINKSSIALLEKFGFEKWADLPNIVNLDGNICDHLYYGLDLQKK